MQMELRRPEDGAADDLIALRQQLLVVGIAAAALRVQLAQPLADDEQRALAALLARTELARRALEARLRPFEPGRQPWWSRWFM